MGLGPQGTRDVLQPGPRPKVWTVQSWVSPSGSLARIPELSGLPGLSWME